MNDTLKLKRPLGLSTLLVLGALSVPSNPILSQVAGAGGEICDSTSTSFWNSDDIIIRPDRDKFASGNSERRFRDYKGDTRYSRTNRYNYLYTNNLKQTDLNYNFNTYHNSTRTHTYHYSWENLYNVNGTCTEVAAANIVLSHETDIGFSWHYSSLDAEAYYLFYNAVVSAVSNGAMRYIGDNNYCGTWNSETDFVLTKTLHQMYEKYNGRNDIVEENFLSYSSAYDKCKQKINEGKACLLSLNKHSVVCKGYEEYEFSWTETEDTYFMWWKTGTKEVKKYKTFRYLAIDLGWGDYGGSAYNTRGKFNTCAWINEDNLYNCAIASLR